MLMTVLSTLRTNTWIRQGLLLLIALLVGVALTRACSGPTTTIVYRAGPVVEKIVYKDKPVLVEKDVIKYVTDKAEVQKVMAENAWLENKVASLNETIAKLTTTGSGQIVYRDRPVPGETRTVREASFKDWRLDFKAVDNAATYTLSQRFEAIATTGKDKQGKPFATVKLLEIGPGESRTVMTNTQAITIQANVKENGKHWLISGAIQGGFAFTVDKTAKAVPGGLVGVKWLTRGYTKAAEDGIFALATPAVFLAADVQEGALLPVSFNIGRVPKQPFKDLWVAPFLTFSTTGIGRYGVSMSATF